MNAAIQHVCFDLDNTLVDDSGHHLRPGMRELLEELKGRGITLSLWTASTGERAREILLNLHIEHYFSTCIFREHFDPNSEGCPKDIAYLNADLLVDDRINHIEFVREKGRLGFLISPFIHPELPPLAEELEQLRELILPRTGM